MQLAEVIIDDFRFFEGDLKDFVECDIYKNRVNIMENLYNKNKMQEEESLQNKKKKTIPKKSTNELESKIKKNSKK